MDDDGILEQLVIHYEFASGKKGDFYCMFNPESIEWSTSNNYSKSLIKNANVPKQEFKGGDPIELKVELQFEGQNSKKGHVGDYLAGLIELSSVLPDDIGKPRTGRPPSCRVMWGPNVLINGVITNITMKLTEFNAKGEIVRAKANITFRQIREADAYPKQNPTSGGTEGIHTHLVKEGETLDWIAFQEYGDPNLWRMVAAANQIDNPFKLKPGIKLKLPLIQ